MVTRSRESGIDIIGNIPWGEHFCQFYRTRDDLTDILVPYFEAGLRGNEFCMWVTSEPLDVEDAKKSMRRSIPDFDKYLASGQMEIIPYNEWYVKDGLFDQQRVLNGWLQKLREAQSRGYEGLRLTGNTFWLEKKDWKSFTEYENVVNNTLGNYEIVALCTYSLERCGALEILDVVSNHKYAIIKREGKWSLIESSDRKKAETEVKESEKRYHSLFENMLDGFAYCKMLFDDEGRPTDFVYLDVNSAFGRLTGLKDVVGKKVTETIPRIKELQPELFEIYGRVALTGHPEKFEVEFKPLGIWLSIAVYSPKKEYFVAVFDNITERKNAETSLRESEQRWSTTLASIGDAVIATDNAGKITFMNAVAEALTGWTLREASQKSVKEVFNIVNEHTRLEVENPVAKVLEKGLIIGLANHTILIRKDSTEVPIDDSGAPIKGEDGKTTGVVLVFRDITLRKQAEEALRKAHDELELRVQERTAELEEANGALQAEIAERKRAEVHIREQATLLDKAQDAVAVRDMEDHITYWNKGAEHLYGWTAKEAIGRSANDLLYKDASTTPIEAKKSIMKKGEWIGELYQVTKDGRAIKVESRWTLVRDDEGKPKSILIINTDITEKKRLETQLLRAQRNESIGMLANGIAHDLNNILAPITVSLELLREDVTTDEGQKTIDILEKSAHRGANLIKRVQSFALGVEGEKRALQVGNIISEVGQMVKETFPRNIEIIADTPKNLSTVLGDATQLHQVLINLCVNARDAMPEGGTLTISAEDFCIDEDCARINIDAKVGQYIVITVSDTGTGIPQNIVDKIFDPFFTTKPFGKGTGLGLAIALSIVKSHGGFINLYSEVGKGTAFKIYLPAVKTGKIQKKSEELGTLAGLGETILVVEDEDALREITCSTLKKYGYKTVTANNGAEAITEYTQSRSKIQLVLMDIMMPSMDGGTCIKALRKMNPDVKIIAVSGLVQKGEHADIKDMIQAFLQKPYTTKQLLTTIHKTLNSN